MNNKKIFFKMVALFVIFFLTSMSLQNIFSIDLADIEKEVSSYGPIASLIYTAILFFGLTIPFNPISDTVVVLTAAIVFSPPVAIIATFIAHFTALTTNYFLSENFGWKIIRKFSKSSEEKQIENLAKHLTPRKIFALRFILPLTAIGIDVVSYAAAISKVNFKQFILASIIPWTILNIIFFTSASYLKNKSSVFVLIPVVVLIPLSYLLYIYLKKGEK